MDSRKRSNLDSFGIIALVGVQLLLGINHVVIKVVNSGIQPIFFCGLRSIIAVFFIVLWMVYRKIPISFTLESARLGILAGLKSESFFGKLSLYLSSFLVSLPNIWIALVLILSLTKMSY